MSQAQEDFDFDPALWPKGLNLFPWMPVAPRVPERYPYQRWFDTDLGDRFVADLFSVFRDGNKDEAELSLMAGSGPVKVSAAGLLTADQCRQLAGLLLSAAADIEAHPAKDLKPLIKEQEQEQRNEAQPVEKVVVPWED